MYEKAHLRSDFRKKEEYLLEWGSNPWTQGRNRKKFVRFLVQMKSAKSPFEINWPLATTTLDEGVVALFCGTTGPYLSWFLLHTIQISK